MRIKNRFQCSIKPGAASENKSSQQPVFYYPEFFGCLFLTEQKTGDCLFLRLIFFNQAYFAYRTLDAPWRSFANSSSITRLSFQGNFSSPTTIPSKFPIPLTQTMSSVLASAKALAIA